MIKNASIIASAFLLLVFTPWVSAQQSARHTINWQGGGKGNKNLPASITFEGASYDMEPMVPKKCEVSNYDAQGKPRVTLSGLSYKTCTPAERKALTGMNLQSMPEVNVHLGYSRNGNKLTYCFYPFVRQNGVVKKVTGYTVNIDRSVQVLRQSAGKRSSVDFVANSKLRTPGWYKMAIKNTGMHKITPQYLKDNNITSQAVATSSLRMLGNSEGTLPEPVSAFRPDDLREVPLKVVDANNDGLFNNNDYALFFGRSPHQWNYNASQDVYKHVLNVYRNKNFYFLSVKNGQGTTPVPKPSAPSFTVQVNEFDDYAYIEDEAENLVGTGREWVGDMFDFTLSYNYDFSFPDIVTSEPAKIQVNVVGRASSSNTSINTSYLGNSLLSNTIPAYSTAEYAKFVERSNKTTTFSPRGPNLSFNLTYNNSANPSGVAWLDFIRVQVRRELRYRDKGLLFRDAASVGGGNVAQFNIANAPQDLTVWDVTEDTNIRKINGSVSGGSYIFNAEADTLREYIAFAGSNFSTPEYVKAVKAQNLHSMDVPEMVIVAHPKFLNQAQSLADFHNQRGDVETSVVTTEQVYNEFSSGGQEITAIRDFTKSLYDRSMANRFKYLLLFGDASYDFKDRLTNNSNYVPVWESGSSFSLGSSSITDDFFAFMDAGEGNAPFTNEIMDIGVGRIPCENTVQARQYVDKVKNYVSGEDRLGSWRNRIVLMADDRDLGWEDDFVISSERLSQKAKNVSQAYNVEKIYSDAYQQRSTTGSQTYPEATQDIFREIQQGALIANYIGHGGEIGLSSEKLITLEEINDWSNFNALPLFMTITCEFTRFDDAKRVSAGEQLFLNPDGGAIALLTTTRVVSASGAIGINEAVFDTVLARPDNKPQTFGQIIMAAKNDPSVIGGDTKNKFSLIGDPAIRLAIPEQKVKTTDIETGISLNKKSQPQDEPTPPSNLTANQVQSPLGVTQKSSSALDDTLKALSAVQIKGEVTDRNDQKLSNYDGTLEVSVFDKPNQRQTLVNDGNGPPLQFEEINALIYRGKVDVVDGEFQFQFRVPLDISYRFGRGKLSYYAFSNQVDAAGSSDEFIVGGLNEDAPDDEKGPQIELYMNDESFVRGGVTGRNPSIFARLADSSGINTVGNGVGHDLKAVIDEKSAQAIVLNEFYEADLNSYKEGSVRYPLFDLEEGEHTLSLTAFDVYNNPSRAKTEFLVADDEKLVLKHVLNYPNPFTTYTEFQFEHNRANQPLDVQVQIFTVSGKLVKTINTTVTTSGNRVTDIAWNGLDDYGDKIGKGVYIYRLKVRSPIDNSTAEKYEKLVILR